MRFLLTGESIFAIGWLLPSFWIDVHEDLPSTQNFHQEPERGRQEQGWRHTNNNSLPLFGTRNVT